jgi:hypothetical protein
MLHDTAPPDVTATPWQCRRVTGRLSVWCPTPIRRIRSRLAHTSCGSVIACFAIRRSARTDSATMTTSLVQAVSRWTACSARGSHQISRQISRPGLDAGPTPTSGAPSRKEDPMDASSRRRCPGDTSPQCETATSVRSPPICARYLHGNASFNDRTGYPSFLAPAASSSAATRRPPTRRAVGAGPPLRVTAAQAILTKPGMEIS